MEKCAVCGAKVEKLNFDADRGLCQDCVKKFLWLFGEDCAKDFENTVTYLVTRDMAIDAGDRLLEGQEYQW